MISFKARADALGRTESELKSEMAASLGRIARTLENLIFQLNEIRASEMMEEEQRQRYQELHQQARLYYWYLIVQRESIGIRNHDGLVHDYRIPDRI
jgi:hypothetical protein